MNKNTLIAGLISFFATIVSGKIAIPLLNKLKAGQPILSYVKEHEKKVGTPTMGGLFFIIPAFIAFIVFSEVNKRLSIVCLVIGLAFMIVGFLDDFLKIKNKENQGLKPYQKIVFQLFIAVFAGFFAYKNNLSIMFIPFIKKSFDIGIFCVPFYALIFIAITNSVNLTDGLDGLASSVSAVYLLFISIIIAIEISVFDFMYLDEKEYRNLIILSVCMIGGLLGFLFFNTNKASIFMGDTGSLALGGIIGAVSIFSSNALFIPIVGIMFVLSSVTVIIQVLYFKKTRKRVFLMTPFHHHLQLKGISEGKISYYYSLVTCIMGIISIIFYL